jgi:group I intron endonuclease
VNGKQYVGQTTLTIEDRWDLHLKSALRYFSMGALHCAIRKYGVEAFAIEQIDVVGSQDELNEKEDYHVVQRGSLAPGGYNLRPGGGRWRLSEESRRKMSESHLGCSRPEATRRKISETMTGRSVSKETCKKLSESWLFRPRRTHCKEGHLMDDANMYLPSCGGRYCWTCHYLRRGGKFPERFKKYLIKEKTAQ